MSQRFFGHPESPLFGVYHAGRGRAKKADRAIVICPPIGQEFIRTHWALRLLANLISRSGIHVLRMDYHGIGDSAGSIEQVDSIAVWTRNIEQAIDHLKQASGAETVMLLGQRLGGTLATEVANTRTDVNSVVLWEPVLHGQAYLEDLRKMHAIMLDLWVCKMKTRNDDQYEEMLGSMYARSLLDEIERIRLDVDRLRQPQLIIDIEAARDNYSHAEPSLQKVIIEDNEGTWSDLRVLETARLRPKTTRTIAKTIGDMFNRLERFGALVALEDTNSSDQLTGTR